MKVSKPPFSAASSSQSTSSTLALDLLAVGVARCACRRASSPRSRRSRGAAPGASRSRKAGIAEAMKFSPSPMPTTSGHSLRAPTSRSGSSARHRDEGVVAAQLGVGRAARPPAGRRRRWLDDQVRDHLGVGLGGELGALGDQPLAQLGPVLDDPVQHDVDPAGGVVVGVRVLLGHAPVRGPARVADAGGRRAGCPLRVAPRRPRARRGCPTACTESIAPSVSEGQPGGVVAAVLEPLEPAEQELTAGRAAPRIRRFRTCEAIQGSRCAG